MKRNIGYSSGVLRLQPNGTNSTMFTDCCHTAIHDDQRNCPICGNEVVGYDSESMRQTGENRWRLATAHWNRKAR